MSGLELFVGVAGYEILILLIVVVILIFGAKKLPELAKSIGRSSGEFKKGKQESEREALKDIEDGGASRDRLVKAAEGLKIDHAGLSDTDLKAAITKAAIPEKK